MLHLRRLDAAHFREVDLLDVTGSLREIGQKRGSAETCILRLLVEGVEG